MRSYTRREYGKHAGLVLAVKGGSQGDAGVALACCQGCRSREGGTTLCVWDGPTRHDVVEA